MRKPIVYILRGLPGSGKTTFARKYVEEHFNSVKRVSKDDLRAMVDNGRHSSGAEKLICELEDQFIYECILSGKDVIVDDTNLNPVHEERIRKMVEQNGVEKITFGKTVFAEKFPLATIIVKDEFLQVPIEECIARDAKREKPVGEQVIRDMAKRYMRKPNAQTQKPQETGKPKAIICDIDGTLALIGNRNPHDAAKCESDELNIPVERVVKSFHYGEGFKIILVSGRQEQFRPQTEAWLDKHSIPRKALFMRATGDNRSDDIVKREIYDREISPKYDVFCVLDDRDRVVKMWRELGIPTFQVNEGNF